jgi:hypothetical protein
MRYWVKHKRRYLIEDDSGSIVAGNAHQIFRKVETLADKPNILMVDYRKNVKGQSQFWVFNFEYSPRMKNEMQATTEIPEAMRRLFGLGISPEPRHSNYPDWLETGFSCVDNENPSLMKKLSAALNVE